MPLTAFDDALAFVLKQEGGYVNNPHDHGGETNKGITQATYDAYLGHLNGEAFPKRSVKYIVDSEVAAIYKQRYWDAVNGDGIAFVNEKMALAVMDGAVQHGAGTSARMFQRTVQAEPDGVVGKVSLACYRLRRRDLGDAQMLEIYCERRRGLYQSILLRDPSQSVFRNNWRHRLNTLCEAIDIPHVWEL